MADEQTAATAEQTAVAEIAKAMSALDANEGSALANTNVAGAAATAGQEAGTDGKSSAAQSADSAGQDKSSGVTDSQYNAAKHLGYTEAEIAEMPPQVAERVERESKRLRQHGSELGQREAELKARAKELEANKASPTRLPETGGTAATAGAGTDAGGASKSTDGDSFDALSKQLADFGPLSPDDVLDEVTLVKKFNGLLDVTTQMQRQVAAVRQDLATSTRAVQGFQAERQRAAENELTRATQDFIAALDHDIFPTYGRGETSALPQGSPELAARTTLTQRAKALQELHGQHGEQVSIAQCLDEALLQLSPDKYKEAARKPVEEAAAKIAKSRPARPSETHKAPAEGETSEQKAAREIGEELRRADLIPA